MTPLIVFAPDGERPASLPAPKPYRKHSDTLSVSSRRSIAKPAREIGIRIALGALRCNVTAMVMREVFTLIGAGLAAGFSLALALANLIRSQLFGLNPRDPLTFVGPAIVLTLAAGSAGFIPALRASSLDPRTALRDE